MSFGFSVGDFIAAGHAFIKALAALKDSTGSAAQYQSLKLIRDSLGTTLVDVQAGIRSTAVYPLPKSLVNAATVHLDHCSRLLKRFDEITQKYAISLAPEGSTSKGKDVWRKIRWGNTKEETDELFSRFREQIAMIETLLALHNACRTEELYVVSQRKQQAEVPQNVGWGDNSPIKFIDACDRRFTVPYEWCLTWQEFCEAIRVNHKDPQERVWVDRGLFEIFDEDNKAVMITSASWDATVSPGKTLSMAMRLKKQALSLGKEQECPTCGSVYKGYGKTKELERVRCTNCGTWFQVSSQPRITELSEDNSVQAPANPTDDRAQPLMRIRRWHVVMEQTEQNHVYDWKKKLFRREFRLDDWRELAFEDWKKKFRREFRLDEHEESHGNLQTEHD